MSSLADSESEPDSIVSSIASGISSPTNPPVYLRACTSPSPWYRPAITLRFCVLLALPLLSLLGAFGTWHLGGTNGTFKSMIALIAQPEALLPGTNEVLMKSYTGIKLIDYQLTILVVFFSPVVDFDGTRPSGALSLFSRFGIGQFGGVWCLMVMETLRMGNRDRFILSFAFIGVIGLIFQCISYTITTPLWLFAHVLISPVARPFSGTHAKSVLLIPTSDLRVLPFSIIFGYIIPTVLMGLSTPDVVSPETHQRLIAFWQPFPIWTVIAHVNLRIVYQWFSSSQLTSKSSRDSRSQTAPSTTYLDNARPVYTFILVLCMLTHIPVLLLSLYPSTFLTPYNPNPSTLTLLAHSTPREIYLPYLPYLLVNHQVSTLTEGVHTFLLWDVHIGSIAFVLWAIFLYCNNNSTKETKKTIPDPPDDDTQPSSSISTDLLSRRKGSPQEWRNHLATTIVSWTVLAGPIGAVTVLLWKRDIMIIHQQQKKIKQGL